MMEKFTKGQTVEYFTNGNYTKGNVTKLRPLSIETWMGILKVTNKSLLRACYLLLLLPTFATAQINGVIQKTASSGTVRGSFGSLGLDTLPRVTGILLNGKPLVYNSTTNKYTTASLGVSGIDTTAIRTVANSVSLAGLQTALNLKANLASPTFTGVVNEGVLFNARDIGVNFIYANNSATDDIGTPAGNRFRTVYATNANLTGTVTGGSFVKSGGTSSQFLKADGSVDVSTYLTSAVTSITGTANQITVTGTTTPVISLPSAITGLTSIASTSGTFSDGTQGLVIRPYTAGAGYGAIYPVGVTPSNSNYSFLATGTQGVLNGSGSSDMAVGGSVKWSASSTTLTASVPITISPTPTTSAGSYDILTRNTSTGDVEKVASSALGGSSGTYTPTLTNVANISSSTVGTFSYLRVGNQVTVYGVVTITITSAEVTTQLGITLPVASNFTSSQEARGHGVNSGTGQQGVYIISDSTNDRVTFRLSPISAGVQEFYFSFQYTVL